MRYAWVVTGLAAAAVLAGCGPQVATAKPSASPSSSGAARAGGAVAQPGHPTTIMEGAQPYLGERNLRHYVSLAQAHPRDWNAAFQAAVAEFDNGHMQQAIAYYHKAIALNPNNGVLYNDEGNVYLRGLKDPKSALPLYQKAVKLDPTYSIAWINLVDCEQALKNPAQAKAYAQQALKVVPPTDRYYKFLKQLA